MKNLIATLVAAAGIAAVLPACAADPMEGYLFVYFGGNGKSTGNAEAIRYAVSTDGYNYTTLNNDEPVIDSKAISQTGGVRDPHIMRRHDGKGFYMVATDMVAANGWDSNRAMVLMKSDDLINWEHSVVNIQQKYPGQEGLKRVWAPQTIYDPEAGKYLIYWSMKHDDGPDIIYYAYANDDFTDIIGEPKPFFLPADGMACIDGDIVEKDGVYHLFYKTEGHGNGIRVATTRSLTSGDWTESPDYKQLTNNSVEGAALFKLIDRPVWVLTYDVYRDKRYDFVESEDLVTFHPTTHEVTMNFKPRHGSIMQITGPELKRLQEKY